MLCVRIDGREVETTPALLARLVFDGKADRHSLTRLPGGTAEQSLEQSLGSPHCEALTGELHRRLQMMCSMDSSAVDVQELCAQVERLCQWRWANPGTAARFFWAAAWLNELTDRSKTAIEFYNAFLLTPSAESHLRLLALNNRGVLQIHLGRLDGVRDLARAAIADCGPNRMAEPSPASTIPDSRSSGLPAACFNLLNLINTSFAAADLLRAVDEELASFLLRLPENLRALWLGRPSNGDDRDSHEEPSSPRQGGSSGELLILRDPTYGRLNSLVMRLSVQARGLVPDLHHPMDRASSAFRRLSLWDCRVNGDRPAQEGASHNGDRFVEGEHHRYAEAASLLLSDDIPSSLTRPDNLPARLEQSAQEELAAIEAHLASGQYELAKSRLQVQRRVLSSLDGRGGLAALVAHVDAQIERIAHLEAQEEQLKLQRACAALVSNVQEFCTLTDRCQAQRTLEDLNRRLQQLRASWSPQTGGEAITLLDEVAVRIERHMHELKRGEIEKKIGDPRRHVRQNRPSDWTIPVPESVYRALAQCRLHDPESWVEDWASLEEQLDAHQGQYHIHRALSALQASPVSWDRVEDELARALNYDPTSWLMMSPLFGLRTVDGGLKEAIDAHPQSRMSRAGRLLERTLQQVGADARKCMRLWQCVERTLSPALAARDVEALAAARTLARRCLDHWPAGLSQVPGRADPRNPVNRFLEACEKARCLIEAEQLLIARPPRLDEAKKHLIGILRLGLDTCDQLRRVVTGLYLAQFHQKDLPPVQRQVLAGLEAWVQTVPQEDVPRIRGQEIVEGTKKVRAAVAERSDPVACRARPDEPATNEMEDVPPAGSLGGRENQQEKDETDNERKDA